MTVTPAGAARAAALGAVPPDRLRLTLPAPTGRYPVGTVALHLVDHSRQDPFLSARQPRELMVSLWYPASGQWPWGEKGARYPFAPWIPAAADSLLRAQLIPAPLVLVTLPGGGTGYAPGPSPLPIRYRDGKARRNYAATSPITRASGKKKGRRGPVRETCAVPKLRTGSDLLVYARVEQLARENLRCGCGGARPRDQTATNASQPG